MIANLLERYENHAGMVEIAGTGVRVATVQRLEYGILDGWVLRKRPDRGFKSRLPESPERAKENL